VYLNVNQKNTTMKNRNQRPRSIFDAFFERDDFFTFNLSLPNFESSEFPAENDSNFNKTEENMETDTHIVKKERWVSVDGTQTYERTSSQSKTTIKTLKPKKEELKLLLDKAVEDQDYEEAIKLRDQISKLDKS